MSQPHQNRLHQFIDVKLGIKELNDYLWGAVEILRKNVDIHEYKQYLFGLFFLKRLNDVFEEESENIALKTGEPRTSLEESERNEYYIPKNAHWRRLKAKNLHQACIEIEKHNPVLMGVFSELRFSINDKYVEKAIDQLLNYFSSIRLRNSDLSDPAILGKAFQSLIWHLAKTFGKRGDEFTTPEMVTRLLVNLLNPKKEMWICDPTAGTGGSLVECIEYLALSNEELEKVSVYAQEKDPINWAICAMNLILHGIFTPQVEKGDLIRSPKFVKDDHLILFDLILSHPTFSLRNWGIETAEKDIYGRFKFGIPPRRYGDMAFLQHMIASLRPNGRMGIILPSGVLFRGGREKEIRRTIIEQDLIEAIIGLPPNLFYGTPISSCILVINKAKSKENRGKILFIDAFQSFVEDSGRNRIRKEDLEKIVNTYRGFYRVETFSCIVTLKEIIHYSYNLNIPLYIDNSPEDEIIDLSMTAASLLHFEMERQHVNQKVQGIVEALSSSMTGIDAEIPPTWFEIPLGELVNLETGKQEKKESIQAGTVVLIRGTDIQETGGISWEGLYAFIPEEQYNKMLKGKIQLNDILMVKTGLNTGKIVYIRELPFPKVVINHEIIIIRTKNPDMLDQQYLYYLLSSELCQKQIRKRFPEVGGGITRSDFRTIQVPLPPITEQKKLANICKIVDDALLKTKKVVSETNKLKQGLMQQLLTGKRQIK